MTSQGKWSRNIAVLVVVVLILGAALAYVVWLRPRPPLSGTQRMIQRLKEVVANIDAENNTFASRERVKYYRKMVEHPDKYPTNHPLKLRTFFAEQLLSAGETAEAIDQFEKIKAEAAKMTPDELILVGIPNFSWLVRDLLATAYLRHGDVQNCLKEPISEAFLFPIHGGGIHKDTQWAHKAIELYESCLQDQPDNVGSRWLLNIAYMDAGEYPDKVPAKWLIPPSTFESKYDIKRFHNVAPQAGVAVLSLAGGAAMDDFDGDGNLDIVASNWDPVTGQIRYFHNEGTGKFTDQTEAAGLIGLVGGLNLCHADYDNDGDPDVFVLRGAHMGTAQGSQPNSLLRNNGNGTFEDVTEEAGVLSFNPTQTANWADYDGDGWLDLFIGNETAGEGASGMGGSTGGAKQRPHPCELYHNNKDGTFTNVAADLGVDVKARIKSVAWGDYNNDGRPDLCLSNMGGPKYLFRNDGPDKATGKWKFTEVAEEAGVKNVIWSFPVWFWDCDNDGWLDLFVAGNGPGTLSGMASMLIGLPADLPVPWLFKNNRDGTFTDVTQGAGCEKVITTMGSNFGDLDNDGYLDFYVGTGAGNPNTLLPNMMLRNMGGCRFMDVTTSGGFGNLQRGHGIAFGDIDNDGDQDIYEVMGGAFSGDVAHNMLFENPGHGNHWITLRLQGVKSNRCAIGTRIKVVIAEGVGQREIHQVVTTGGSFGCSSLQAETGLGQATKIQQIEIYWPASGLRQVFENVEMDRAYKLREGDAQLTPIELKPFHLAS